MEQFFSGLSKRQTMLLLTALTYGGSEAVADFDLLSADEGEVLKHRSQEILQIPREKRIPLLVNEIKRLVTARRGSLWSSDPDKLAAVLKHERPALVEVVLRALPAGLTEEVRKRMPPSRARLTREVRPEVLNIIRWRLEEVLARRSSSGRVGFKFSDMLLLKSRELITVIDRMGARALATSLAGLPDAEREQFLAQLSPDQRQLAQKAIHAGASKKLKEADAREILVRYDSLKGAVQALRNAGTQRVARACLAQSPEFAARMVERHPGDVGRLLMKWIKHERPKVSEKGDYGRADIVEQLERLAAKGIIDRPVRLPPPPKAALAAKGPPVPAGLPGGRVLLPPARGRDSMPPPRDSIHGRPSLSPPQRPSSRDPIAERESRRLIGGDPIARRSARLAGVALPLSVGRRPTPGELPVERPTGPVPAKRPQPGVHPRPMSGRPGTGRALSSPVIDRPPVLKSSTQLPKAGEGTSVQRPPRVVDGRTGSRMRPQPPPRRGPKGSR